MKVVILAGGSGSRLWPLSRERYPKQFLKLYGRKDSLFQETFRRSLLLADLNDIVVVTNFDYKFLVTAAIEELGLDYDENNIIVEPCAMNTLPAIYAGVNFLSKESEDSIVVFPSDHLITNNDDFVKIIKNSEKLSLKYLITFGIKPVKPHTGYGYISLGKTIEHGNKVEKFIEKPNLENAEKYIKNNYLWNSGIFMFGSKLFKSEVEMLEPSLCNTFRKFDTIDEIYKNIENKISIDYGILEKSDKIVVIPSEINWNDLGSFDSFYDVFESDENNNILSNETIVINSKNNLIHTTPNKLVATVGVDDLIVMDHKDALLICKKDQSQEVKKIVEELNLKNDTRTKYHVRDFRPWGQYTILDEWEDSYEVKRIKVYPGKSLSLQFHYHRSEHWIVLKGMATVTIEDEVKFVRPGESVFVKSGQKHRLENFGKIPLEIIEVQIGDYLKEDDIVRLEDKYGRK